MSLRLSNPGQDAMRQNLFRKRVGGVQDGFALKTRQRLHGISCLTVNISWTFANLSQYYSTIVSGDRALKLMIQEAD